MEKNIKRKSIILILSIIIAFSFILMGCSSKVKTAYDIAVEHGYLGTEAQWLESLNGEDAEPLDIYEIYQSYLEKHPDVSFDEFLEKYLTVNTSNTEAAANTAMRSVVSIVCGFYIPSSNKTVYAAGSGVIYSLNSLSGQAYIITNYHVIYEATAQSKISNQISIYVYGKAYNEYAISATYVGGSIDNDIAVLKAQSDILKSETLSAAKVADSNSVRVGETAIVVGNPSGEGISVTSGIVSVDSENIAMESLANSNNTVSIRVMRVDSAINGGNSGGGLFNINGELIGIVNAKTVAEEIEGIGYAIPSNVAVNLAENIISIGGYRYALGITSTISESKAVLDTLTSRVIIEEKIVVEQVDVASISNNKIFAGDVLVSISINGNEELKITRSFHLSDYMLKANNGDKIVLKVMRNNAMQEITLITDSDYRIKIS